MNKSTLRKKYGRRENTTTVTGSFKSLSDPRASARRAATKLPRLNFLSWRKFNLTKYIA